MIAHKAYDLMWGEAGEEGHGPDWGAECTLALFTYGIGVWGVAEVVGFTTVANALNVPGTPYGRGRRTFVWADLHWPSVPAAAKAWRLLSSRNDTDGLWLPDMRNEGDGGEPPSFGYVRPMGELADALLDYPDADARVMLRVHAPDGSHCEFECEVVGATWDGGDGVDRVVCTTGRAAPGTCELITRAALAGEYDGWLSRHSALVVEDLEDAWEYAWGDEPW